MSRAQLSIGIIFKNEIRCLERCLQSLQPLREAVPCELVMADTGSTDGSRKIAEKYADILFDFPWINDFSAARNAVIDHCSGKWYISVDADEWLDDDISEITALLRSPLRHPERVGSVVVRNYFSEDFSAGYEDFLATRMIRMSSGLRYVGLVHEYIPVIADEEPAVRLHRTIFHHDGYVGLDTEQGKPKLARNMALMRLELEQNPDDLRTLMLYIESCRDNQELPALYRRAVKLTRAKGAGWKQIGPPVLRHAVAGAWNLQLPELEEWAAMAEEWFPHSYFTTIDISYIMTRHCMKKEAYADSIRWSEQYIAALSDYRAGRGDQSGLLFSTLRHAGERAGLELRFQYAHALCKTGEMEKLQKVLEQMVGSRMDAGQIREYVQLLISSKASTALSAFYRSCSAPDAKEEQKLAFLQAASVTFASDYREKEEHSPFFVEHDYRFFKSLNCEIGTAAAILEAEDPAEMEVLLAEITNWDLLPIAALEHALASGAAFPPRLLNLEAADKLAARLSRKGGLLVEFAIRAGKLEFGDGFPALIWARGLVLAAMQTRDWQKDGNAALCHAFAKVMGVFLPRYYGAEALCGEGVLSLPLMHRFGWYCAQAFRAKEDGDPAEYVRILRLGLENCEAARPIVEFLLENLQEEQGRIETTPELLALAEQVRNLLCVYPADDPAVEALKQSAAYRQVAHLIERPNTAFTGSIKQ